MSYQQSKVVEKISWLSLPTTCDFCAQCDGKTISITENFFNIGDELSVGEGENQQTMRVTFSDVGHPPLHPNCYSKDTEVYTDQGWKHFYELNGKEKCLSLNPNSFNLGWQPIKQIINYQHTGKMHYFHSRSLDILVTPDHAMFVKKRWDQRMGRKDKYQFIPAKDLPHEAIIYRSSRWQGEEKEYIKTGNLTLPIEAYCRLMGYYLSEGCVNRRKKLCYQICISQHQQEKLSQMHSDLSWLPLRISKAKSALYIFHIDLGRYLEQFGKSHERYVPEDIKRLSPRLIDIFLDAYCLGDGSIDEGKLWKGGKFKDSRIFFTSSPKLAEDIGELILKMGKRPSFYKLKTKGKICHFRNGDYKINHDIWRITECHRSASQNFKRDIIDYNDPVYCVELPEWHTLWVRRNGKTAWCGNCMCTIVAETE